ncbi:hypothetical protein ACFXOI_05615 [Streptomyces bacillaris]|uniref:hypothetical protein n=1 Tax=Streptomyces bacillaris TaxID=68179 RepID=UPI0013A6F7DB
MSTQTIETTSPQSVKPLAWKTGVQAAANATWKVLASASSPAEPFFTCQKTWDRTHYAGEAGYLLLAPLLEIAAAYDVPVTKTQTEGGSTTYKVVVPVDGTTVTLWTTDPDDAATAVEA